MITDSLINEFSARELAQPNTEHERGSVFQRHRIRHVASLCAQSVPGDLLEIGVYVGGTSVILAAVAEQYGRRLVCVDNWPLNNDYDLANVEQGFYENIAPFSCVDVVREDAHAPETVALLSRRKYCFAFADDCHSYEDHRIELDMLLPITTGVICVDDVYLPEVRQAVADAVLGTNWKAFYGKGLREAWLVQ